MDTINLEITQTPDTGALSAIHAACFESGWSERAMADLLATGNSIAVLACVGSEIRGFAMARVVADEAEILTLAVPAIFRRQGIASQITAAMCQWIKAQGAKAIFLEVRQSNFAAQALYTKAGFAAISRRKLYYQGNDGSLEDAMVMRRSL